MMRRAIARLGFVIVLALPLMVAAQDVGSASPQSEDTLLKPEQLDALVAPVALYVGVIAQEVEAAPPDAVTRGSDGSEYGNSGVMTFLVDHARTVYQKDPGENAAPIAERMTAFNPDQTWKEGRNIEPVR